MNRFTFLSLTSFFCLIMAMPTFAFAEEPEVKISSGSTINPIIESAENVQIGKRIYLDASKSAIPLDGTSLRYSWESEGKKQDGKEAFFTFTTPGVHTVTLRIEGGGKTKEVTKEIFTYQKIVTFLYTGNASTFENTMPAIYKLASQNGVLLHVLGNGKKETLMSEDGILQELLQNTSLINSSTDILAGPRSTDVLSAYKKYIALGNLTDKEMEHHLILTTQSDYWLFSKVLKRIATGLGDSDIVLVNQDPFASLNFLLQSKDFSHFKQKFDTKDFEVLSSKTYDTPWWLPLSTGINQAISNNIPSSLLSFLLLIPFILALIAFFKQCIGIETLNILQTLILILSFYILGIKYGTFILFLVIFLGIILRTLLQPRIQFYIPRVTLTLSFTSLAILLLLLIGSYFNITFGVDTSSSQRALLSTLPMLLIAFQADKLSYKIFSNTGKKELIVLLATYLEVILAFYLARVEIFRLVLLALPELVLLAFVIQYSISQYTGLRLVEIVRFRALLLQDLEE